MPTAAQEESMRKLTEMLGYSMKYYRSATTDVTISYAKTESDPLQGPVHIDRFTNIKDADDTVNYVTLKAIDLFNDNATKSVPCIEGELVTCETDNDNIISISLLDDNNRYYRSSLFFLCSLIVFSSKLGFIAPFNPVIAHKESRFQACLPQKVICLRHP